MPMLSLLKDYDKCVLVFPFRLIIEYNPKQQPTIDSVTQRTPLTKDQFQPDLQPTTSRQPYRLSAKKIIYSPTATRQPNLSKECFVK